MLLNRSRNPQITNAAKQIGTAKTNTPNKRKNMSPRQTENKLIEERQPKRKKGSGTEPGITATSKKQPLVAQAPWEQAVRKKRKKEEKVDRKDGAGARSQGPQGILK